MPKGGFTYALASRLGQALRAAEEQYGPRDMGFTILGCEFVDSHPGIWFPRYQEGLKHVVVHLSPHAFAQESSFLWELAHEAVHLLDPAPGATNFLEEGVAVRFARNFMVSNGYAPLKLVVPSYLEAVQLVDGLEGRSPGCARALREKAGRWRDVTAEVIHEVVPECDSQVRQRLVETFAR